jgi:hypothetical protein
MIRTQHPSNNDVLGAPKGWDQGHLPVSALPITRTQVEGLDAIMSFWRPTPEEIAAINAGGTVSLLILGSSMPPVSLTVDIP